MDASTTVAWPQQIRLRGQAAAPPGPIDMTAMYVMHHGFRRDLEGFAAAAQATPVSDREAWAALRARWELFALLLRHHHDEVAGLRAVLQARVTPEELSTLRPMEEQRAALGRLLPACGDGFARLANHADDDARAALSVRLSAAKALLGHHLTHEETAVVALLQRYLSGDEWSGLEAGHLLRDVRLSGATAVVPWAGHGLPADVWGRVLRDAGLPFRLIHLLTRRRFARRHAVAFRYVEDH